MLGFALAYVVAICAMLFAGVSALTLIYTLEHLDGREIPSQPKEAAESVAV